MISNTDNQGRAGEFGDVMGGDLTVWTRVFITHDSIEGVFVNDGAADRSGFHKRGSLMFVMGIVHSCLRR